MTRAEELMLRSRLDFAHAWRGGKDDAALSGYQGASSAAICAGPQRTTPHRREPVGQYIGPESPATGKPWQRQSIRPRRVYSDAQREANRRRQRAFLQAHPEYYINRNRAKKAQTAA